MKNLKAINWIRMATLLIIQSIKLHCWNKQRPQTVKMVSLEADTKEAKTIHWLFYKCFLKIVWKNTEEYCLHWNIV